jgi:hypothetical protein
MTTFNWQANSSLHSEARLAGDFYVEIRKGTEMVKLTRRHEYNHKRFYGILWSYSPEYGRMVRREIGNHITMGKAQAMVEAYISQAEVQKEINDRLDYYVKVKTGEVPAKRVWVSEEPIMVVGYDARRLMDLEE